MRQLKNCFVESKPHSAESESEKNFFRKKDSKLKVKGHTKILEVVKGERVKITTEQREHN